MTPTELCDGIGTFQCIKFRNDIFMRHFSLAYALATNYVRTNKRSGYVTANTELLELHEMLKISGTGLFADQFDSKFIEYAKFKSNMSEKNIRAIGQRLGAEAAIAKAQDIVKKAGLKYPATIKPNDTKAQKQKKHIAAMARISDAKWWRRNIRHIAAQKNEQVYRLLNLVSEKNDVYVSNNTLERVRAQKKRNSKLLNEVIATNEEGFEISLADAAESGMSNPVNQRNELMVRLKGYENISNSINGVGVFITLTAPSQFHATHVTGYKNSKFNGSTPSEVQVYLNSVWGKVRASWERANINTFGFRIAEPHHDGTPHWHLILFFEKEQKELAINIFQRYAIEQDIEELGNDYSPRFKSIDIEEGKSAVGYVAKYISKNIDGFGVGQDEESGTSSIETSERVKAWASTWHIRQFQQIGTVSVTVWREIRRSKDIIMQMDDDTLKAISLACEEADWARFVELMGGVFVKRNDQTLRPLMEVSETENQYGEYIERIKGIIMRGVVRVISRWHTWTITKKEIANGAFQYSDLQKEELQIKAREIWRKSKSNRESENRSLLDLCQ